MDFSSRGFAPRSRPSNAGAPLTILPILNRELLTSSRRGRLQADRAFYAAVVLAIVLVTFGTWYYQESGHASRHLMSQVAWHSFLLIVLAHAGLIFGGTGAAAFSIAREKDRRTLDFLLATPLGNAEIVLAKLAFCMIMFATTVAAAWPVVILLNLLGGIDLRLILLAYGGIASTAFFSTAFSIWISTGAPDARRAVSVSVLGLMGWAFLPVMLPIVLPRLGLTLPGFLFTANAWVLASSPLSLVMRFVGVTPKASGLVNAVAWMAGLQAAGGAVLLIGAIARLRSAYRVNLGGDGIALGAARKRPVWRFRPRPPVGDDPILWRERYTARAGIIAQLFGLLIALAVYGWLAWATVFFTRPALAELWRNGYASGLTSAERPEFNLMLRFFFTGPIVNAPPDSARVDLNLFLRFTTTALVLMLALIAAACSAESITSERARETWFGLITTPLSPREILRSKLLAGLWRLRGVLLTLLVLWLIGLLAGAIHPLGFLLALLAVAAWTWLPLVFGLVVSVRAKNPAESPGWALSAVMLPICSGFLPFVLPARLSSVLLGAGSTPFVTWLSLLSYRDVRAALHYSAYPHLAWSGIATGEGLFPVLATCLLGILAPALGGFALWRYLLADFDRQVGRPTR
jgi:ABC-type transport system involved in multi-copper enzyme maturation permease subunit